jgi:hypothetical protein
MDVFMGAVCNRQSLGRRRRWQPAQLFHLAKSFHIDCDLLNLPLGQRLPFFQSLRDSGRPFLNFRQLFGVQFGLHAT